MEIKLLPHGIKEKLEDIIKNRPEQLMVQWESCKYFLRFDNNAIEYATMKL
jgi:hypothetical protein